MKFYPYEKGGGKSFSYAEGGGTKRFLLFFTLSLEVLLLDILNGRGAQKVFTLCREGAQNVLPRLEGRGAHNVSDPRFSNFEAPPPPN